MLLSYSKAPALAARLTALALFILVPMAPAQELSKAELKKLIATAATAQDHERIARHFDAKAAHLEAEARDHEELAQVYAGLGDADAQKHPNSGATVAHCRYFAKQAHAAAAAARKVAAAHRAMAKPGK